MKMLQAFSSNNSTESSASQQHQQQQQMSSSAAASPVLNLPSNWAGSSSITSSIKLDKKHFDKVNKLAEKLLKYCQSERLNLINSPPYIIDILPDICQAFNTIYFVYENKLHILNEIDYFCVLIKNCVDKFQQLVDLFKLAGKKMYEETSVERQQLIKYTLTFSHILAEVKSLFPKDIYEGQNFRIAKKDAADFWRANFADRIIVTWKEFEIKLNRVHQITSQCESDSLRETIQLTKTKYVSIFEFDIFTRLFQPWNNLLNNWKFLVTEHPGYIAYSTYDEVHKRLQNHINKPGSYLYRLSCTKLGQWAIGYVTADHKILQTIPQSLVQALIDGQKQGLYLYPDGKDIKIDISSAIAVTSASRIQISKEQFDMYCDIGTSFQMCKICSENNKDRKLEPCGHLICSSCLESWQEKQSAQQVASCPFCRCEIKAFEPIIISPFEENETNQKTNKKNSRQNSSNESINTNHSSNSIQSLNNTNKSIHKSLVDEVVQQGKFEASSNVLFGARSRSSDTVLPSTSASVCASVSDANSQKAQKLLNSSKAVQQKSQLVVNQNLIDLNNFENLKLENDFHLSNDEEEYLVPAKATSTDSKFNIDFILQNQQNQNSKASCQKSQLVESKFISPSLPGPPSFPPPPPPPPLSSSTSSQTTSPSNGKDVSKILTPPLLPPPPLPQTIVGVDQAHSSLSRNSIRIKIENELLFEQALAQLSADRTRAACALLLANNDVKLAKNILNLK